MSWAQLARRAREIILVPAARIAGTLLIGVSRLSARLAAAMSVVVLLTAITVGALTYRNIEAAAVQRAFERIDRHARLFAAELEASVRGTRGDVSRRGPLLDGLVRASVAGGRHPVDGTPEAQWRDRLAALWVAELMTKPTYDQFRLIGLTDGGREIVRVDRRGPGRAIRVVPEAELQRKGGGDYFKAAIKLAAGEIYASPIDFNREDAVVETPHVPTLRVAAPVFAPDGNAFGIVVINVDMRSDFGRIYSAQTPEASIFVVNGEGDYLVHPDQAREFGFERGRRMRVQDDFPAIGDVQAAGDTAPRVLADATDALYGVAIAPVRLVDGANIAVIAAVRYAEIVAIAEPVRHSTLLAGLSVAVLGIALAWVLARSLTRPLVQMTRAAEALARGDVMTVPTTAAGEIGVLARAFARTTAEVRDRTAALQESSEMARGILSTAMDAFVQMDESGKVVEWNPRSEALFGWSRAEAIGQPLVSLIVPPAYRERHMAGLERFLRTGDRTILGKHIEIGALLRDGREIMVELTITPLAGRGGYLFNGFIRDMTERIKLEQQLRQWQKMEAIGRLTGGVAHDFNNLLTVILTNLELMERKLSEPQSLSLAQEARRAAEMGARLTDRLLTIARRQQLETRVVNLNGLVVGLTDLLRRTIGPAIELSTCLALDLWPTMVDPGHIEGALLNLVINARDAMPDGGRIILETANVVLNGVHAVHIPDLAAGDYVILQVSDTGHGMTADVKARAFDPFFTTKEEGKGSGLGLSTVYGFARQSGGNVTIYSEVGKGTTVKIYLPRASGAGAGVDPPAPLAQASSGRGETVLVVEDDDRVRQGTVMRLAELGYRVLDAGNGPSALEILHSNQAIDIVFSDLVMPGGMTGLDLARRVRELYPSVRVVLTSGYSAELISGGDLAELGVRLIRKPYTIGELARAFGGAVGGT